MIEYTLDGLSVRNISTKLSIPSNTIWLWRTKIMMLLDTFIDQKNPLSKLFYTDETYLKINLKATKSQHMPRVSYKTKQSVVGHRELVCIQTVIDDTKRTLFKIDGVARSSKEKLNSFIKPVLTPGAIMVSDGERSYVGFSWDNDIIDQAVIAPKRFSEDGYNLAPINSLHSAFKFISRCRGVSTDDLKATLICLF